MTIAAKDSGTAAGGFTVVDAVQPNATTDVHNSPSALHAQARNRIKWWDAGA
jgi:hypothetical protein